MENVVLVIHLFLALAIIGLVLLQRSEGGGLGIGGGGGGLGNIASAAGMNNVLTKATSVCAAAFFGTSLLLGILAGTHSQQQRSIFESLEESPAAAQEISEDEGAIKIEVDGSVNTSEPPSAPIAD